MSEEDVERAASDLDDKLRSEPWFISTGVGETKSGFTIFVYAKNQSGPKKYKLHLGWMGIPVVVRAIGRIRRISETRSAA